jgi:hypothetical protein
MDSCIPKEEEEEEEEEYNHGYSHSYWFTEEVNLSHCMSRYCMQIRGLNSH